MNELRKRCTCDKENSLTIDRKQASRLVSCSLLCAFFIFVAGYFWGKKKAFELYSTTNRDEVASGAITESLDALYDEPIQYSKGHDEGEPIDAQYKKSQNSSEQIAPSLQKNPLVYYKAQLIGFGTLKAAEEFVGRLKKEGITTSIVKRASKPSGRNASRKNVIYWYQVITEAFSDKHNLEVVVEKIKNIEKIHGIQIIRIDHDGNARQDT
jgi:hypothetical protein